MLIPVGQYNTTIKILSECLAWHNVHLIGNFHFTDGSSMVDIEARRLAAHYQNEDFWWRSMSEAEDEGASV